MANTWNFKTSILCPHHPTTQKKNTQKILTVDQQFRNQIIKIQRSQNAHHVHTSQTKRNINTNTSTQHNPITYYTRTLHSVFEKFNWKTSRQLVSTSQISSFSLLVLRTAPPSLPFSNAITVVLVFFFFFDETVVLVL